MSNKLRGYILGIVGGAAYGLNPLFAVPLYKSGLDASSVVFYRYLTAVVLVAALAKMKGYSLKIDRKSLSVAFCLGLMVIGSSLSLFHSYNYMDVGIASTILYVYPVMVAAILALFYNERLSLRTGLCIVLAMAGIALLYVNGDGVKLDALGAVLALVSALTYAIYMVCINKSRLRRLPTIVVTFYILLMGLVIYIPFFLAGFRFAPVDSGNQLFLIFCIALFPTVISFVCTASAVLKIGSTPASILGALEPATAVVVGVCVFNEHLTIRTGIGMLLVLVAVLVIITKKEK
ncbi:MAG: DMT family transporter [Paludibacteraceae bacterium]|nr:EamA family transporter [Candidatus Physcocola equi]MCQ2235189.1 DMT family transporter [Paludibacteraceae bacterium]